MKKGIVKKYTNGEITVVWQTDECIHSGECFTLLPEVFKPHERPWVKIENASTEEIIKTVNACPTVALTYYYNNPEKNKKNMEDSKKEVQNKVTIYENGPLMVPANINVVDSKGNLLKVGEDKFICRCGHSKNKPFCDGTHMAEGFKG
jgi:uncharacterized Fe-S cluster protein YjdI